MTVALVTDLIFASRIEGTARKLGQPCRLVRTLEQLEQALRADTPRTVLLDLNADDIDAAGAVAAARRAAPEATVVAYLSHVQTDLARRAREAGAHQVLPRSAFVQQLPALLADGG